MRWGCSVLRARAKVARAENNGAEFMNVIGRYRVSTSESYLNDPTGWQMYAREARRDGRRVVGYNKISGPQKSDKGRTRLITDATGRVNDHEPCVGWALDCFRGGDHGVPPEAVLFCSVLGLPVQDCSDGGDEFACSQIWTFECCRVGVRNGERVHWRIHIPRIKR